MRRTIIMNMKKMKFDMRMTAVVIVAFCMIFAGATAHAALSGVGPTLPLPTQYPLWYQDSLGLSLGPCWDYNGFCTLLPPFCPPSLGLGCLGTPINFDPAIPINSTNFPIETFYFDATTKLNLGPAVAGGKAAKFVQTIALEGSFGGLPPVPAPSTQTTFLRINLRVAGTLAPNATYTVIEPYGTYTFTTGPTGVVNVAAAGQAFRAVDGGAILIFDALLPAATTNVGPFLVDAAGFHVDPLTNNVYIGAGPLAAVPVVNGPNGNVVTVTGPNAGGVGVASATSNVFFLSGKVIGVTASVNAVPVFNQPVVFPVQKAGFVSTPVTITLTNPDKIASATLGAFAITGANAADFTIAADTCSGATLAAGTGTCTFNVTFSEPTATAVNGAKSAVISFPNTAPANKPPTALNLSGAIDTIAPTVTATLPANNAINVPANNALTATFSEPVTGVSNTTFTLDGPAGAVTGVVAIDPANKVATFTPDANLQSDQTYTGTISSSVTDLVGNPLGATAAAPLGKNFVFSFATTNPNTTAPTVVATDPADNSTGARVNDPITVTFNEAIQLNPLSINATTFFLSEGVTGSVTYDPVTRTATLRPAKSLDFFHKYTATVTTGVKSLGGVPMAANVTFSFLTNGAPSAPDLFSPEDGATGVALPVQFQWVRSTDIDGEPVTYNLWFCTNPGFLGCNPVQVTSTTVTAGSSLRNTPAGLGGYGAGMLLAGFAIVGGVRFKRKIFFFIAVLAISGMMVAACGKTKTNTVTATPDPSTLITKSVSDLKPETTYYWKVVADDGNGALIESETRSFTTL
jgi:Big-like domain-containing protein